MHMQLQELLPFLSVTVRAWRGVDVLEVEWTAGPIPIQDNLGKEISIKYQSTLNSGNPLAEPIAPQPFTDDRSFVGSTQCSRGPEKHQQACNLASQ